MGRHKSKTRLDYELKEAELRQRNANAADSVARSVVRGLKGVESGVLAGIAAYAIYRLEQPVSAERAASGVVTHYADTMADLLRPLQGMMRAFIPLPSGTQDSDVAKLMSAWMSAQFGVAAVAPALATRAEWWLDAVRRGYAELAERLAGGQPPKASDPIPPPPLPSVDEFWFEYVGGGAYRLRIQHALFFALVLVAVVKALPFVIEKGLDSLMSVIP